MNTITDFNEAQLAEHLVNERLENHFLYSPGLGWVEWDGRRWSRTVSDRVKEVARQWVLVHYEATAEVLIEAARDGTTDKAAEARLKDWRAYTFNSRLRALVSLAGGMLLRDATDFAADPDRVNCANGIIDLRKGELQPHHPSAMFTKITPVEFHRDRTHPDWDMALTALPEDEQDWYRVRVGQALTGYPPPDDVLIIQHASGNNGKSSIMAGVMGAAGDYFHLVSHRALLSDPSAHTTEIAAFRGVRVAFMDELPFEK